MNLFDECKEALRNDFHALEGQKEKDAFDMLHEFPLVNGNISWSNLKFIDYVDMNDLILGCDNKNYDVFVFADDVNIPIFKTNLSLIIENIYDVTALSPKIFIFNHELILQPLFPTETIRLGRKY